MSSTVERRGAGLAWREIGAGDAVVFLHGLGGTSTAWSEQLSALAATRRCVAWDMPGYGDSEPLVGTMTFASVSDRLVDLLDELDVDHADLVGLSLGGMHALHTALEHPDRIRRLVLTNTSPRFGLNGTTADEWTASRLAVLDDGMTLRELAPTVLDGLVATPLPVERRNELIASFAHEWKGNDVVALDRRCAGDLNLDGEVDTDDLDLFAEAYETRAERAGLLLGDHDGDGALTERDIERFWADGVGGAGCLE